MNDPAMFGDFAVSGSGAYPRRTHPNPAAVRTVRTDGVRRATGPRPGRLEAMMGDMIFWCFLFYSVMGLGAFFAIIMDYPLKSLLDYFTFALICILFWLPIIIIGTINYERRHH
jgi:hypothetical protein